MPQWLEVISALAVCSWWWISLLRSEGAVGAFLFATGYILPVVFLIVAIFYDRAALPSVFYMYLAASAVVAIWLGRGKDPWSVSEILYAALPNVAVVGLLDLAWK